MSPRRPALVLAWIFLFSAAIFVIPFIIGIIKIAANPYLFDAPIRTLYIFFPYRDPELFPNDYSANYFLSLWIPSGFKLLQYIWAQCADPLILHRALPPFLWLVSTPMVFYSAKHLKGLANAIATTAIYLCSSIFLFNMSAGVAHAFAIPLIWWAVAALISGRPKSLAFVTVISAALYPPVTPVAGLTLAFWLLFPRLTSALPQHSPILQWSLKRKLIFLTFTACMAGLLLGTMALSRLHADYGRSIHVFKEDAEFPESGASGRNSPTGGRSPLAFLLLSYLFCHNTWLGEIGSVILTFICMGILLAGVLLYDQRDRRPGNLKPFIYAIAVCFLGCFLIDLDTAYRFIIYPIPVLIMLFFPLILRQLSRRLFPAGKKAPAFICMVLVYIFCIAKADPNALGYMGKISPKEKDALLFIQTLPKDIMTAGWPGLYTMAEEIPYFARRKTLVTRDLHTANQVSYLLTMRGRMNAIVDAYLARDIEPVLALRDNFHVDYLVVVEKDLTGEKPPKYFEPFATRANQRWSESDRPFILLQLVKAASVYSHDGIDIIDLHRL